jgi:hypothetical protein
MKVFARRNLLGSFGGLCMFLLLGVGGPCAARTQQVPLPQSYARQVTRGITGRTPFTLVQNSHPTFALLVSDRHNLVLKTAAEDFSRYFQECWGSSPISVYLRIAFEGGFSYASGP